MPQRYIRTDPTYAKEDDVSNALLNIDYVHAEVHEGNTFEASYKTPDASPIADNAYLQILIKTGSKSLHCVLYKASGGDAEGLFLEAPTVSASGTAMTLVNMNRLSSKTPTASAAYSPTTTASGTTLHNSFLPGGRGPNSGGGTFRSNTEWILKPDTNYVARLINRSGGDKDMSISAEWYEE